MKNLIFLMCLFLGFITNAQTYRPTVTQMQSYNNMVTNGVTQTQLTTALANTPTSASVSAKADKTYVDSQDALKASTSDVNTALSGKANTADLTNGLASKQNTLVSGTNIKTIGGVTLLGTGDVTQVQNSMLSSTTLAPTATAVINYVTFMPFTGKTAAYTLLGTDYCVTLTTGSATFTLPSATALTGKEYVFKNKSTGVLTVSGSIEGGSSRQFTTQNTGMRIISNGTTWDIIGLF